MNTYSILRKKYPEDEYALMKEVSDMAGVYRSRSADYIAVNLWPSRGLRISGFEEKASRYDWLKELKNPKKAENIFQYCDYWWLITHDETIAKIEEIPETWGWMAIKNDKIFIKKQAPKLTPKDPSKHFVAAMLKRAASKDGFIEISSIKDKIEEATKQGRIFSENEQKRIIDELRKRIACVDELEKASGMHIGHWVNDARVKGEAVKFILNGGVDGINEKLISLKKQAESITESITKALNIEAFK